MRNLPVLYFADYHFWEHYLWMQDIQKWHLTAGCADSLALICHFQKRSLSQIFQHGRFMGRRVKAGYLWVEADNGHFITQTSLILKLLFSRIRQMTSSHDFDFINWNWLQYCSLLTCDYAWSQCYMIFHLRWFLNLFSASLPLSPLYSSSTGIC